MDIEPPLPSGSVPMGLQAGHQTMAEETQVGTETLCWEPNKWETATRKVILLPQINQTIHPVQCTLQSISTAPDRNDGSKEQLCQRGSQLTARTSTGESTITCTSRGWRHCGGDTAQ